MTIALTDVTVTFGRTLALDQVSAELPGGITGIFGPNGSGKSTLLRVIAGLIRPSRGAVAVNGTAVSIRDETFRQRVGYAGHESGLYGRLTLAENLRLFATMYGTSTEAADAVISTLQLDELAARPVRELSAGSKRRAAVARALVHDPDLLLLDEPYANVDDDAADAISASIMQWNADGKIALVATHGAKKVKAYADGGLVLQRGRLVRVGRYTDTGFTAS